MTSNLWPGLSSHDTRRFHWQRFVRDVIVYVCRGGDYSWMFVPAFVCFVFALMPMFFSFFLFEQNSSGW